MPNHISKTRGVPSQGTTRTGPRGQTQEFRNFIPAPNCFGNCPNPTQIYYTPALGGAPCPPSHPNTQAPNCAPPQQVQCDACMGGQPVTNMFPNSCPPNWSPHIAGVNPCSPVLPPPLPPGITTTFINNIASGLNRFGCSFLYRRHTHLLGKLNQLQQAGTNPNWQQMLTNRISHINSLIMSNCTGGPTPGPGKPIPNLPSGGNSIPTGPMMNATGGTPMHPNVAVAAGGRAIDEAQAVRVAQVVGLWFN